MHKRDVDQNLSQVRMIHRYVQALDQGDVEEIAAILEAALDDPELDRVIEEINLSYQEELHLTPITTDAEVVRELVSKHILSAFEEEKLDEKPLTVGEVAARLQADRSVPSADQEANRSLLSSSELLPPLLSIQEIRKLADRLRVKASDRYWRNFRDTAITLGMGRGQSQAQLAAARDRTQRKLQGEGQNSQSSRGIKSKKERKK